ncbi:hypothetical protein WR25_08873 [Diploscapter pachys]|uniref:ShKT domain-containing protein n=1 Tax=Diploscapter pachys TaxID=2018661 RepID=A0A2A2JB53_9BILA|nr:hypothetical protein WR25_08873 [Diploscapter pachys]
MNIPQSCGREGRCAPGKFGNRCICPAGWMGRGCRRPCQDIYTACKRWKSENKCTWTKRIFPFYADNCGASCGACQHGNIKLRHALPPLLENIAWFIGRWECTTTSGERYPESISGAYHEILDVAPSEVPEFDRPPVNITVTTRTLDGRDMHIDLGFLTSKPFNENTGFIDVNKPLEGDDLVAIETVNNNGMLIIEEGTVTPTEIKLEMKHRKSILSHWKEFRESKRMFILRSPDLLEERVYVKDWHGREKKWLKRYKKTFDYLQDYVLFTEEIGIFHSPTQRSRKG